MESRHESIDCIILENMPVHKVQFKTTTASFVRVVLREADLAYFI